MPSPLAVPLKDSHIKLLALLIIILHQKPQDEMFSFIFSSAKYKFGGPRYLRYSCS